VNIQIRKGSANAVRNLSVQTQAFDSGAATFDTTDAGANPSSYLPGGINGAPTGYQLNGNGPATVNVPYICAGSGRQQRCQPAHERVAPRVA